MAKVNVKQREALIKEMNKLASSARFSYHHPKGMTDNKRFEMIDDIVKITRLLLDEVSVHEFIVCTKDKDKREYYKILMEDNAIPSTYKKIGYGPMHGKYSSKNKKL